MALTPSAELTGDELDALFDALDIWSKIRDERLTSAYVTRARSPSRSYGSGVSYRYNHRMDATPMFVGMLRQVARG